MLFRSFNVYNGSTSTGNSILCLAYEKSGASLSGVNGEFVSGTYSEGSNSKLRYAQLQSTSDGVIQASYNYPKLMGNPGSGYTAGQIGYRGSVLVNDVYNTSTKTGNGQGIFLYGSDAYLEDFGFKTTVTMPGRGLRIWYGVDQTANGTVGTTIYGTIQVYGMLRGF